MDQIITAHDILEQENKGIKVVGGSGISIQAVY